MIRMVFPAPECFVGMSGGTEKSFSDVFHGSLAFSSLRTKGVILPLPSCPASAALGQDTQGQRPTVFLKGRTQVTRRRETENRLFPLLPFTQRHGAGRSERERRA